MLYPFLVSPLQNPYPFPTYPASMRVLPGPTYSLPPQCPSIPLHWGMKPSQDQGPPLPFFPLIPPLGSLCSVQCLTVSI